MTDAQESTGTSGPPNWEGQAQTVNSDCDTLVNFTYADYIAFLQDCTGQIPQTPYAPVITSILPNAVPRGKTPIIFTVTGDHLENVDHAWLAGLSQAPVPVANVSQVGFTFETIPAEIGIYDLHAFDSTVSIARMSAAVRVTLGGGINTPLIFTVTPSQVLSNTLVTYTVTGTKLGTTDGVYWEGVNNGAAAVANVTDTGFTFEAKLVNEGYNSVVATTGGNPLARKDSAILVGAGPTGPTGPTQPTSIITSVVPTEGPVDANQTYTVVGTGLATTDEVSFEGPGGVVSVPQGVTDTGFTFDATATAIGAHEVIAVAAGAELAAWLAVNIIPAPVAPTITAVTPTQAVENILTSFTVLGTALDPTTGVIVEGPGGGAFLVANVTATGFTFDATLTVVGSYNVIATGASGEIARYDAAITVIAATVVPATITSVTPPAVDEDVSQLYTVLGTDLAATVEVVVEGPSGVAGGGPFPVTAPTFGTFTFTANLTEPGLHNVVAVDATSGEIARLDAAITVADVIATITTVTPTSALEDTATDFSVIGVGLAGTTGVTVDGLGGVTAVPTAVTDTSFNFNASLTEPGTYGVIATGASGEIARKDASITVGAFTAVITAVTPGQTDENLATLFTVTGTGLLPTDGVIVEGPGGVTVVPTGGSVTDTGFTFTATLTSEGTYNVIATAAGAAIARYDAAIVVTPVATITSVNPTMAQDDTLTVFAAIGTGLEGTTQVTVEGPGGVDVVPTTVDSAGFGFDFEATLTDIGVYNVIAVGAAGEIARYDAAITVGAVIATITSITPSQSIKNAPESFIVTGTGLDTVDLVIVEGLGGVTVTPDLGSITATGFTFSATLTEVGDYNVIASATGSAIARADAAITVVLATITSVNPTAGVVGTPQIFDVIGTGLTNVDGVTVEGAGGVAVPVLATPVPTDTSFSFEATLTADDVYDVIATIASAEHARLDAAITVATAAVPIITQVTPVTTTTGTLTTFTAVGEFLELTATVTMDGPTPVTGIVPTSVDPTGLGFVFDATLTQSGPYTVIAVDALDAEIARWNLVINVTPLGIVTDVTPPVSPQGVITAFTATGIGLLPTDGVRLEGGGEIVTGVLVGTPTDTLFDFTAVLNQPGDYDVIATTFGNPLAREDNAIFVPTNSIILDVTPGGVAHDILTTYLVEGIVLGTVTKVNLVPTGDLPRDGVAVEDIVVTPIDDYSFSFDAQLLGADIYSLYAFDATDVEVANKQGAISVSATTSVITTVVPPEAVVGVPTTFTVTGVDL